MEGHMKSLATLVAVFFLLRSFGAAADSAVPIPEGAVVPLYKIQACHTKEDIETVLVTYGEHGARRSTLVYQILVGMSHCVTIDGEMVIFKETVASYEIWSDEKNEYVDRYIVAAERISDFFKTIYVISPRPALYIGGAVGMGPSIVGSF